MNTVIAHGIEYPELTWINSEERGFKFPKTWDHPDRESVAAVREGDFVKVGIEGWCPDLSFVSKSESLGGERFWVQVTQPLKGGRLKGRVYNHLVNYNLPVGSIVDFSHFHVMDVMLKEHVPS